MAEDRQKDAFRRLMAEANTGGQAKVDALVALTQRTVLVATWTPGGEGYRTISNANGQTALPIFTDLELLEAAGSSLEWEEAPHIEVGARAALRHAIAHNLTFVVVDIGTEHALEIDQDEIQPLLTPGARRESSGPYAGVGRVSSDMMRAVKPTPVPGSLKVAEEVAPPTNVDAPELGEPAPAPDAPTPEPPPEPTEPKTEPKTESKTEPKTESRPPPTAGLTVSDGDPGAGASATFGSGSSVAVQALDSQPSDVLLRALAEFLRTYPEVEWAALAAVARGPADAVPTVGLRVDASFRQHVNEIVSGLRKVGDDKGASLDVLLLDDPQVMRDARAAGILFYPWRRRS